MKLHLLKKLLLLILVIEIGLFGVLFFQEIKKTNILFEQETTSHQIWWGAKKERTQFEPEYLTWEEAAANAPWSKRDAQTAVVFDDKIWLMGGIENGETKLPYELHIHKSDVWVSENGKGWRLVTDKADWGERRAQASVVFKDKIWLIGGWEKKSWEHKNDVWYSEDGLNWFLATSSAGWSPRRGHSAVVFNDKIWLIGGVDNKGAKNDVWYSEDGVNWESVGGTDEAPWSKRYDQTVLVFKNKLWLIGGVQPGLAGEKDIWVSEDGKNWQLLTNNPPWPGRHGHCTLLFKERIWILGGWDGMGKGFNDVWYSEDGLNWKRTLENAPWVGREDHSCGVLKEKIWVMGGMSTGGGRENDVWYSVEVES